MFNPISLSILKHPVASLLSSAALVAVAVSTLPQNDTTVLVGQVSTDAFLAQVRPPSEDPHYVDPKLEKLKNVDKQKKTTEDNAYSRCIERVKGPAQRVCCVRGNTLQRLNSTTCQEAILKQQGRQAVPQEQQPPQAPKEQPTDVAPTLKPTGFGEETKWQQGGAQTEPTTGGQQEEQQGAAPDEEMPQAEGTGLPQEQFDKLPPDLQNQIRQLMGEYQNFLAEYNALKAEISAVVACENSCACGASGQGCPEEFIPSHNACITQCDAGAPALLQRAKSFEQRALAFQKKAVAIQKRAESALKRKGGRTFRPVQGSSR